RPPASPAPISGSPSAAALTPSARGRPARGGPHEGPPDPQARPSARPAPPTHVAAAGHHTTAAAPRQDDEQESSMTMGQTALAIPDAAGESADPVPGTIIKGATFSPDGSYRYSLRRCWADGPLVAFVGLNPS